MKQESKLNLNAGDYAISHCDSDKTYNGLEVHKMLCDAYIAGNNDTLEMKEINSTDAFIRKARKYFYKELPNFRSFMESGTAFIKNFESFIQGE